MEQEPVKQQKPERWITLEKILPMLGRALVLIPVLIFEFGWHTNVPKWVQEDPNWIADEETGCAVFTPGPKEKETVSWSGECKLDKAEGNGILQWSRNTNAYVYNGSMHRGYREGQGSMTYPGDEKYTGQWKEGKPHGTGTYTWPVGQKYVGEWKNGKQDGKGTMSRSDGTKFIGPFLNDKMHGQFMVLMPDGSKYLAQTEHGKIISEKRITKSRSIEDWCEQHRKLCGAVDLADLILDMGGEGSSRLAKIQRGYQKTKKAIEIVQMGRKILKNDK